MLVFISGQEEEEEEAQEEDWRSHIGADRAAIDSGVQVVP